MCLLSHTNIFPVILLRQYCCEKTGRRPQLLTARFTLAFGPRPFDTGFLDARSRRTLVTFGTGLFGTRRYRLGMVREPRSVTALINPGSD
jgi:hypothetical protein